MAKLERNKWYEIKEQSRIYVFPGDIKYHVNGIVRFKLSDSGNHYLDTKDGKSYVVALGWYAFSITWVNPEDGWTTN